MIKITSVTAAALLISVSLLAGNFKPLTAVTSEACEELVRKALVSTFEDVIDASAIVNKRGFLQIALMNNAYITEEFCYVEIYTECIEGRTHITVKPFKVKNGERVSVANTSLHLGIRILIEGTAEELDYNQRMTLVAGDSF